MKSTPWISLFLLTALWAPLTTSISAASTTIVISEFRTRGPAGGNDEFVELHNLSNAPVDIGGWTIRGSNAAGTTGIRATIPAGTVLGPGCFFLATNAAASGYSGAVPGNMTYTTGITDDGGVAIVNAANAIVDAAGMSAGSAYREGSPLTPTASNIDRGIERRPGGLAGHNIDTDNNAGDFAPIEPGNPQNLGSACVQYGGGVTVSVSDVSVTEGDSGQDFAIFTVTASANTHAGITFDIAAVDGVAPNGATSADGDFEAVPAVGSIAAGQTIASFLVLVNGDTKFEPNETYSVVISNVNGASIAKAAGIGTIVNDDPAPPVVGDVVISQVYGGGGNAGATLTHDFVELFNRGTQPVDVTGWSVQYVSAAGAGTWAVTPLAGVIPPGRYYLVQQAAGNAGTMPLPSPDAIGSIPMGGTSGKVALQVTTTPITGACPLANTADLVGYGASATCFELAPIDPATSNTTAALRKRGGCFDTNNNDLDFSISAPTPRNAATPSSSCTATTLTISQIQGSGSSTSFGGQFVATTGIVTALKSNGFFMQSANADDDAATSEGIFVFTQSAPPASVGDAVSVLGTASEFFDLTQVEASLPGDVTVQSSGNPLPAAIALTTSILDAAGSPDQLERFEGMRVSAASLTSVAPTNEFGEIETVLTGVTRPMREPGISVLDPVPVDPASGAIDCCIPRFDENPERIMIDSDALGLAPLAVTSHVVLSNVSGPLDYTFSRFKIALESAPSTTPNIDGIAVPEPDADELTVAGYNIENFTGGDPQLTKASLAIRQLMRSPDVIGHVEILDQPTLQALANKVNADAVAAGESDPQYQAILIPFNAPTNTQNVGFLVKTSRVRIDAFTQELAGETFVDPADGSIDILHDRPPLVLRATFGADGANPSSFIAVINHLRSFIDIELLTGAGPRVRAKRTAQAESVARLLQQLQTDNPGVPVISLGDYNAYQFNDGYTDPINVLKGQPTPDEELVVDGSPDLVEPNFVNLTDTLPFSEQYSFIFEGTPQLLDHVLVNAVGAQFVQRFAIARGNADFPEVPAPLYAANTARPERSSDHDMPVAYFRFPTTSAAGAMSGGGQAGTGAAALHFSFEVEESDAEVATFEVVIGKGAQRIEVIALGVDAAFFSDDAAFVPGPQPASGIDSVVFTGAASVNGAAGYTYEVRATDRGEPGRNDTFTLILRDALGAVVLTAGGQLTAGNVQSHP